jgi:hypothetical protein
MNNNYLAVLRPAAAISRKEKTGMVTGVCLLLARKAPDETGRREESDYEKNHRLRLSNQEIHTSL